LRPAWASWSANQSATRACLGRQLDRARDEAEAGVPDGLVELGGDLGQALGDQVAVEPEDERLCFARFDADSQRPQEVAPVQAGAPALPAQRDPRVEPRLALRRGRLGHRGRDRRRGPGDDEVGRVGAGQERRLQAVDRGLDGDRGPFDGRHRRQPAVVADDHVGVGHAPVDLGRQRLDDPGQRPPVGRQDPGPVDGDDAGEIAGGDVPDRVARPQQQRAVDGRPRLGEGGGEVGGDDGRRDRVGRQPNRLRRAERGPLGHRREGGRGVDRDAGPVGHQFRRAAIHADDGVDGRRGDPAGDIAQGGIGHDRIEVDDEGNRDAAGQPARPRLGALPGRSRPPPIHRPGDRRLGVERETGRSRSEGELLVVGLDRQRLGGAGGERVVQRRRRFLGGQAAEGDAAGRDALEHPAGVRLGVERQPDRPGQDDGDEDEQHSGEQTADGKRGGHQASGSGERSGRSVDPCGRAHHILGGGVVRSKAGSIP